jgi:hypothetical protein
MCIVFIELVFVIQLIKQFPAVKQSESSSQFPQKLMTQLYIEALHSSPSFFNPFA